MKKIIYLLIANLLLCKTLYAASIPTIHFATEATYPPFEYIDETGKIKGFDIEIAQAICQQMKASCQFDNQAFNSLLPSLALGKFDAIISALGITKEREQQVAFSNSYYTPSGSFTALTTRKYTLNDLQGKTIGVQIGSTYEKYLNDNYGDHITIKTYASIQDALLDLKSERIDMVLADTPIIQTWIKQDRSYSIVDKPISNANYFGTGYGIAVRHDNQALQQAVNAALAAIKSNGTYTKIAKKYFG